MNNDGVLFDLRNGIPELRPKEDSHCFFLVEHSGDKSFMSAVAQQLLTGKCKDFHFYGRYGGEWENAFDDTDIALYQNEDDWSLTSWWQSYDDFRETLELQIEIGEDVYFFFDTDL